MISIGLGCFPSNIIWFLWNQMHHNKVRVFWRIGLVLSDALCCCRISLTQESTMMEAWVRCRIGISAPNQTAQARSQCRKRCSWVSMVLLHIKQFIAQCIPLRLSSALTGSAWCSNFQVMSGQFWWGMDSIVVKRVVEPQGDWNSRDTFKRVKIKKIIFWDL